MNGYRHSWAGFRRAIKDRPQKGGAQCSGSGGHAGSSELQPIIPAIVYECIGVFLESPFEILDPCIHRENGHGYGRSRLPPEPRGGRDRRSGFLRPPTRPLHLPAAPARRSHRRESVPECRRGWWRCTARRWLCASISTLGKPSRSPSSAMRCCQHEEIGDAIGLPAPVPAAGRPAR